MCFQVLPKGIGVGLSFDEMGTVEQPSAVVSAQHLMQTTVVAVILLQIESYAIHGQLPAPLERHTRYLIFRHWLIQIT